MLTVQLEIVDAAAARLVPSVVMAVKSASAAQAARVIGNVRLVKLWAPGTPPRGTRGPLYRADDIVADELVETIEVGALHIRFIDDTKLRLGEPHDARQLRLRPGQRAG